MFLEMGSTPPPPRKLKLIRHTMDLSELAERQRIAGLSCRMASSLPRLTISEPALTVDAVGANQDTRNLRDDTL